ATDAVTGEPVYREKHEEGSAGRFMDYVRASSSLPFLAPPVEIGGRALFDGGVSDPIPVGKSVRDGNEFHVIVLTREPGYRKKPGRNVRWLGRRIYPAYGGLMEAMERRWRVYNESLERAEAMEKEGRAVILRPPAGTGVDRTTKDERKLTALYERGYADARAGRRLETIVLTARKSVKETGSRSGSGFIVLMAHVSRVPPAESFPPGCPDARRSGRPGVRAPRPIPPLRRLRRHRPFHRRRLLLQTLRPALRRPHPHPPRLHPPRPRRPHRPTRRPLLRPGLPAAGLRQPRGTPAAHIARR